MHKNYLLVMQILSFLLVSEIVFANNVYIEQAGSTSTIDITQSGSGNRVGTSAAPSTFSGNSQDIDIVQTGGDTNIADLIVDGGSTIINYNATGSTNDLQVDISGGTGTDLIVTKIGDSNRVTVCGTNDVGVAAGNAVSCSTGVTVNDTSTTINITGDSNSVNMALNSPNATNVLNIGQTTVSNSNVINVTQTGALATHNVNLTLDGSTNTVNITQAQP